MPKRLRTAGGKLKVQHTILPRLRGLLEQLVRSEPRIHSVIPGEIRPVRNPTGRLQIRVTVPTPTGWKAIGLDQGARQELFFTTTLSKDELEKAIADVLARL